MMTGLPVIPSRFRAPWGLGNGHLQTVLPVLWARRVALRYERERLELADGDFVDLDWARAGRRRLAILSHGLEGGSEDSAVRSLAAALNGAGWDALAWNFRGCGGEPNRLSSFYNGGDTGDLRAVIAHAAARYPSLALAGFSLGGNLTLKYLGEGESHPAVVAGVGISAPVDITASSTGLDRRWSNLVYRRRLIGRLVAKVRAKALKFPGEIDASDLGAIRTFEQFDNRYTAPLHGFPNAAVYWAESSARPYLPRIRVPTLLLNARNDPFLGPECFPYAEAEENPALFLEVPESGGHVGFLDFGPKPWLDRRVVDFLASVAG